MGQPKIKASEAARFAALAKTWPAEKQFSWESLRAAFAFSESLPIDKVWSRQALTKHAVIKSAFDATAARTINAGLQDQTRAEDQYTRLKQEFKELEEKYHALMHRHRQLAHNVSFLTQGKELLLTPIPSNVQSQTHYATRAKPKRNSPF